MHVLHKMKEAEFPVRGTADEKLRFVIRYAIMAPSSHNTQAADDKELATPRRDMNEVIL